MTRRGGEGTVPAPYALPGAFAALFLLGTLTAALGGRLPGFGVLIAAAVIAGAVAFLAEPLAALKPNFVVARAFAAEEFRRQNGAQKLEALVTLLRPAELLFEAHVEFKKRVPGAIGLIRTGDSTPYGNL